MTRLETERKWQKRWESTGLYKFNRDRMDKKFYVMEMFSYPSGANLHVGHWYNFGLTDVYARFMRMCGYNVFHPMGFDAFGLPAENYAIKTGIHPHTSTMKNIETMEKQLKEMGASFDWDFELMTCTPDYYKWTQWLFIQLFKKGLAYRKNAPVNWCDSCQTVLANEQVIDGECERCGHEIRKKNLTQWFFKITDYAEELLSGLGTLDWPEKTKQMQRNWIGKSTGGEITFEIKDSDLSFTVFTTRADTLYGCTYVVLAPEHPIVDELTMPEQKNAVEAYRAETVKQAEIDRLSTANEKTGVFTGSYAINPINGRAVPIWVADYVLLSYGTGCVMAVPAHDERDFEFATKYGLPIERVIEGIGREEALPFIEYGRLVNSGECTGLTSEEGKKAVIERLKQTEQADFKVNYRLRDWLISRQRYWGAPIPIIHCEHCGEVAVTDEQLPVLLPMDVDFTPDGTSPLLKHESYMNVKCPECGADSKRDPDTMDTFMCSSWYFLRYPDNQNDLAAWDTALIDKMLPVDKYVGGAEHACMHLLYARFFVKACRDMGLLHFDEPFLSLVHQGVILGSDGNKMSKSLGNTVSPDDYINQYGSDVFRMYLMFGFNYIEGGAWSDDGIKAIHRFVQRVERLVEFSLKYSEGNPLRSVLHELAYIQNAAIKAVTNDFAEFRFNTAIARLMEYVNFLYKQVEGKTLTKDMLNEAIQTLILLLAPAAPHLAEQLWEDTGNEYSVFNQSWPEFDESALARDEFEYAIQLNGKVRMKLYFPASMEASELEKLVMSDAKVAALTAGKTVVKVIVIPNRLVNIVVR